MNLRIYTCNICYKCFEAFSDWSIKCFGAFEVLIVDRTLNHTYLIKVTFYTLRFAAFYNYFWHKKETCVYELRENSLTKREEVKTISNVFSYEYIIALTTSRLNYFELTTICICKDNITRLLRDARASGYRE